MKSEQLDIIRDNMVKPLSQEDGSDAMVDRMEQSFEDIIKQAVDGLGFKESEKGLQGHGVVVRFAGRDFYITITSRPI